MSALARVRAVSCCRLLCLSVFAVCLFSVYFTTFHDRTAEFSTSAHTLIVHFEYDFFYCSSPLPFASCDYFFFNTCLYFLRGVVTSIFSGFWHHRCVVYPPGGGSVTNQIGFLFSLHFDPLLSVTVKCSLLIFTRFPSIIVALFFSVCLSGILTPRITAHARGSRVPEVLRHFFFCCFHFVNATYDRRSCYLLMSLAFVFRYHKHDSVVVVVVVYRFVAFVQINPKSGRKLRPRRSPCVHWRGAKATFWG